MLSGQQGVDHAVEAGAVGGELRFRLRYQMARVRAGQLELALQVGESDVEIHHGHLGRGVAEQLHEGGKIYAGAKHLAGIGVTQLMRNDAAGMPAAAQTSCRYAAELANEGLPGCGTGQQTAIGGQRIERAEEAKTLDQFTDEGIDRDHAFGFQLAERHVNRPLIRAGGVETIEGEIDGFADAHAGVAEQQEDVGAEIVAAQQFLLEQLILLRRKGRGASVEDGGECPGDGAAGLTREAVRVQASSSRMPRRKMSRMM